MLVIAEPDLGSGLVYVAAAFAVLYIAGVDWKHLTAVLALGVAALVLVLVVGPAGRLPHLPGGPPDGLLRPGIGPGAEARRPPCISSSSR